MTLNMASQYLLMIYWSFTCHFLFYFISIITQIRLRRKGDKFQVMTSMMFKHATKLCGQIWYYILCVRSMITSLFRRIGLQFIKRGDLALISFLFSHTLCSRIWQHNRNDMMVDLAYLFSMRV